MSHSQDKGDETFPYSLFKTAVEYVAKNFDGLSRSGLFWDKIVAEGYTFPPNVADALLEALGRWDQLSDRTLAVFGSPRVFPLTTIHVGKGTGGTAITLPTILDSLDAHARTNLRSLTLSGLSNVTFEDLVAHFFLRAPSPPPPMTIDFGAIEDRPWDELTMDVAHNATSLSEPTKGRSNKTMKTASLLEPCDQTSSTYRNLSRLDLSDNNYTTLTTNHAKMRSRHDSSAPDATAPTTVMEVDAEIDFYFYFRPRNRHRTSETSFSNGGSFGTDGTELVPGQDPILGCIDPAPSLLPNLRSLNLSQCSLYNSKLLGLILAHLTNLEWLDLSLTGVKDLGPLAQAPCAERLKHLGLHGLQVSCSESAPAVLTRLTGLVSLDISEPAGKHFRLYQVRTPVHLILSSRTLPKLRAIDLSGVAGLSPVSLVTLIELHPDLKFLGLMLCHACYDPRLNEILDANPSITVAGEANESQLLNSLMAYGSRPGYLQKGLQRMFSFTRDTSLANVHLVKIILNTLDLYPAHLGINLAGTACLYNIVKIKDMETCLGLGLAKRLVNTSLNAMENFFSNQQLQKNVIILLCNDWIINSVEFNRLRCTKLVLNCLCVYKDQRMIQMCAAITSLIAAKMSIQEVNELGSKSSYVKRLLEIIMERVNAIQNDAILKLCLSAIWNLTDESPKTCENFIREDGISVYFAAFEAFRGDTGIVTKFLGSLSNVAEVRKLRKHLLTPAYVAELRALLCSSHVPVSYFAAGICAHLASTGARAWERCATVTAPRTSERLSIGTATTAAVANNERNGSDGMAALLDVANEPGLLPAREDVLRELADKVLSWQEPETELVSYRSFKPFFHLLQRPFDEIGVHLWALWALCHVTSKNPQRYMELISREDGHSLLIKYRDSISYANEPSVRPFVDKLLELIVLHDGK